MSLSKLEWPPPGLGDLHGRIRSLTRWCAVASCIILAASMGFARFVPREFFDATGSSALLFVIWGGIGVLVMIGAAVVASRDVSQASSAVRRGYTWLTIAETMCDSRGDTGALISGEREYADLSPEVRSAIRVARVTSSGALLLAAVLPVPGMVLAGWFGSFVGDSQTWTLITLLAPSVVFAAVAGLSARVERFAVRDARLADGDAFARRDASEKLVAPWYASFDAARGGQPLGRGRSGGAFAGWAVASIASIGVVAIAMSLLTLWIVSMQGPEVFTWQNMRTYTLGLGRDRTFAVMRAYRTAPDPSITPQRAGDAWQSLVMRGGVKAPAYLRAPNVALADFPALSDTLFPFTGRGSGRGWFALYAAVNSSVATLNPRQRDFLATVANVPGWDAYHVVAAAPGVDLVGSRFAMPFADTLTPFSLLYPTAPSTLAYAANGRAGFLIANGKLDEAESVLRDLVAIGFHLVDDGVSMQDETNGLMFVNFGRQSLNALYRAPAMAAKKVQWDSAMKSTYTVGGPSQDVSEAARARAQKFSAYAHPDRDLMLQAVVDTEIPHSIRFGLVRAAGALVCTDARELLLGPSEDLREAIATARKDLVHTPAEEALFNLNYGSATRPYRAKAPDGGFTMDQSVLLGAAKVAGFVLRNSRISNCAQLAVNARRLPN